MMDRWIKLKAFTLAEVLITLGILGVVAAMTIPTLMKDIQDIQYKTAAKKAFSVSSSAVQQMKQDEGGDLTSYYTTANSFKPVFMNYFKIIKDCGTAGCVPQAAPSSIYSTLHGEGADSGIGGNGQFVTADGMFFNIRNTGTTVWTISITVDVNGYTQKPNAYGRDTFMFQIVNDALLPMGAKGTVLYNSLCDKTVQNMTQGLGCMSNVMQGIDY